MPTKPTKAKGAAVAAPDSRCAGLAKKEPRTIERWQESTFGLIEIVAARGFEDDLGDARRYGADVGDAIRLAAGLAQPFVSQAQQAFLDGDDVAAARRLVSAIQMLGSIAAGVVWPILAASDRANIGHESDRFAKTEALRIWGDERATFRNRSDAAPKIAARVNRSPETVRRWLRGA